MQLPKWTVRVTIVLNSASTRLRRPLAPKRPSPTSSSGGLVNGFVKQAHQLLGAQRDHRVRFAPVIGKLNLVGAWCPHFDYRPNLAPD
jgi:hypothetical protein